MDEREIQHAMEPEADIRGVPTVLRAVYDLASKFWMDEQGCVLLTINTTYKSTSGEELRKDTEERFKDCAISDCEASRTNPKNGGSANRGSATQQVQNTTVVQS